MTIAATRCLTTAVFALAALGSLPAVAQTSADATDGLNWRLLGPMRAGWSTVAKGIADQPDHGGNAHEKPCADGAREGARAIEHG